MIRAAQTYASLYPSPKQIGKVEGILTCGRGGESNPNRWFGQDAAGFSLGYYDGDYQAIGQNGGDFLNANLQAVYTPADNDLFNGNISHMVTAIHQATSPPGFTPVPQATTYRYDRLNRIKQMKAYQGTANNDVMDSRTGQPNLLIMPTNTTSTATSPS
jgi:hypothetical protein